MIKLFLFILSILIIVTGCVHKTSSILITKPISVSVVDQNNTPVSFATVSVLILYKDSFSRSNGLNKYRSLNEIKYQCDKNGTIVIQATNGCLVRAYDDSIKRYANSWCKIHNQKSITIVLKPPPPSKPLLIQPKQISFNE